jgi:hypothetical protein
MKLIAPPLNLPRPVLASQTVPSKEADPAPLRNRSIHQGKGKGEAFKGGADHSHAPPPGEIHPGFCPVRLSSADLFGKVGAVRAALPDTSRIGCKLEGHVACPGGQN